MKIKRLRWTIISLIPLTVLVAAAAVTGLAATLADESADAQLLTPSPLPLSAQYLPIVPQPMDTRTPLPPPIPMSSTTPIDFEAVRLELQAQGLDLAFNKIGFHTGLGGNIEGLIDSLNELDQAGVPFFLKSVDNAEPLYLAQQIMQSSGISHTLVYRRSGLGYDFPDYNLPPAEAAAGHWEMHRDAFPPELDPSIVWIETLNEVDKNRAEWLAEFALETAQLALADGFRWAAFGWSSGEPEPEHWWSPAMLEFLELAGENPDRLAIALHEYSFTVEGAGCIYPYLVGRFQTLFHISDIYRFPRPTVLITEWGWEYQDVPEPMPAMEDIEWAAWLYAAYPEVKGAAIWFLGGGFGGIADQAQRLIAPVKEYSLSNYFAYVPGTGLIDPTLFEPEPDNCP